MDWKVAWLAVALCSAGAGSAGLWAAAAQARGAPLIRNPVVLNIGFVCRWQNRCTASSTRNAAALKMWKYLRTWRSTATATLRAAGPVDGSASIIAFVPGASTTRRRRQASAPLA